MLVGGHRSESGNLYKQLCCASCFRQGRHRPRLHESPGQHWVVRRHWALFGRQALQVLGCPRVPRTPLSTGPQHCSDLAHFLLTFLQFILGWLFGRGMGQLRRRCLGAHLRWNLGGRFRRRDLVDDMVELWLGPRARMNGVPTDPSANDVLPKPLTITAGWNDGYDVEAS